jgi:hypothetical protein
MEMTKRAETFRWSTRWLRGDAEGEMFEPITSVTKDQATALNEKSEKYRRCGVDSRHDHMSADVEFANACVDSIRDHGWDVTRKDTIRIHFEVHDDLDGIKDEMVGMSVCRFIDISRAGMWALLRALPDTPPTTNFSGTYLNLDYNWLMNPHTTVLWWVEVKPR